ncbi:hypothetical protein BMS3Abin03_03076 [bacterium BMS3Abin03]|nr:hypothetical protein BMS3Abin03_03076 [bacterium BMS3Abin03]
MKKKKTNNVPLFLFLLLIILLYSCAPVTYEKIYPTLKDGKYDSEFPYKGSSNELEQISKSVNRINSTGFYRTYLFNTADSLTMSDIRSGSIDDMAIHIGFTDKSSSGTGTIIYSNEGKVALLTCAHVINYPDTVISYTADENGYLTNFVEVVLVKVRQRIYAAGFPEGSELEILAMDKNLDVALIGRNYTTFARYKFPVFSFPPGKAKELEWGTFVYIFGYPMNYQMITKALVSSPDRDGNGSFLVDAVVNRGYSGGIVLAIKDGIPNFELVGIVQWVPEERKDVLIPLRRKNNEPYSRLVPYKGNIYVDKFSEIKYGITRVISIESIKDFLKRNKDILYEKGYALENYIKD